MHETLPEGLPEVLCYCDAQDSIGLKTLKRVYAESKLATHGYCLGWRPGAMKRRKISPESLLAMRRKKLRKTVEEKYPLFADEMEQRTLEAEAKKYSLEALRERAAELESMEDRTKGGTLQTSSLKAPSMPGISTIGVKRPRGWKRKSRMQSANAFWKKEQAKEGMYDY